MIAATRRLPTPPPDGRGRRRARRDSRPAVESLEDRAVPAGSIVAAFDGLTTSVISVTLPQPASNGAQLVSLTLPASPIIPTLQKDVATGKHLNAVTITLDQVGNGATDTITLSDALIASFQTVSDPTQPTPTFVVTVASRPTSTGSIAASFDGQTAPVVDVTLTPPTANGFQTVRLTLAGSPVIPTLQQDVATGKRLKTAQVALVNDGNASTDTITLSDALVTSFQAVGGATNPPTFVVTLEGQGVPVAPTTTSTATFDGLSPPVLGVVLSPPSSGTQQATFTLGLSAADIPLILDAILGRSIKTVAIVQDLGDGGGPVTTTLTNARITSFRIVQTPSGSFALVLTLRGQVSTPLPT